MTDLKLVVELAFRLHEQERITRDELVRVVEQCVNAVAIENGYADEHGLPFPELTEAEEVPGAP